MKIAVYGASGYTGKLVVRELHRRGFDIVLSSRSEIRLRDAARAVGVPDAEVRPAGIDDPAALLEAFSGCDAVINCAGPFGTLGGPVVRAAIEAGSHYIDTAAEQLHIKHLFDRYAEDALRAGVAVVPSMGYDILPGDLIAHLTGVRAEPLEELTVAYSVSDFDMTRGTIRSAIEMLKDGDLVFEDGDWAPGGVPAKRTSFTFPGHAEASPTIRWPGGEVATVPRHVKTQRVEVVIDASAFTPEIASLLEAPNDQLDAIVQTLPEGPAEDRRRAAAFTIVAEAVGHDGRQVRGVLQGSDIYGITAVITAEGARRLVEDGTPGGVLAPAQAFDAEGFLTFLAPYGISWKVGEAVADQAS